MFRNHLVPAECNRFSLWIIRTGLLASLAVACGVILGSSAGCSSKTAGTAATADPALQTGGAQPDGSLHGESVYLIDANRQIRWAYEVMPDPAPSSKPNYLLKSYRCEKGSASLNGEARGAMGQLVEMLNSKPAVRIVCIGLCDGHPEKVNANNLGMSRAQTAKKFLTGQGISKDRIEVATFASTQASAAADETIGQSEERRVEVWLLTE